MNNSTLCCRNQAARSPKGTVLEGNTYSETPPQFEKTADSVVFKGKDGDIVMTYDDLSRPTVVIGSTGFGKTTNVFFPLVSQIMEKLRNNDKMFVFDSKQDYLNKFYDPMNPNHIVISLSDIHATIARGWNSFGELFDRNGNFVNDSDISEMVEILFSDLMKGPQPFFPMAAKDMLVEIYKHFLKEAVDTKSFAKLNNAELNKFIEERDMNKFHDWIDESKDREYLRTYLGGRNMSIQHGYGVIAFLNAMRKKFFFGSFVDRMPAGQFSIRRLVRESGPKVIFLEYDVNYMSVLSPVYSLFFDLMVKEACNLCGGNTFIIADELNLMPACKTLELVSNFGRGKNIKLIAGLQSISQLEKNYGEAQAKSIASGFVNAICFNAVDRETREYISGRFGKTFEIIPYGGANIPHDSFTVTDSDIHNLDVGEAFVDMYRVPPFKMRFSQYV